MRILLSALIAACTLLAACQRHAPPEPVDTAQTSPPTESASTGAAEVAAVEKRLKIYAPVRLTTDLSVLSDAERQMLVPLVKAADIMNELFWLNAYGPPQPLLDSLAAPALREFARINYGPWDRLDDNRPFVPGVGPKPPGANFYPRDMTKAEFDAADLADKTSEYSLLSRRDDGALQTIPYHVAYAAQLARAAEFLRQAAALSADAQLVTYLNKRADALVSDDYRPSDLAWLDMKTNRLDIVIGPIETYEDMLYGYKAAYEAYVLVKDLDWSERLARYAQFLPELQQSLPVAAEYRAERPGTDSDLNAYDVVFYAGDANAGSKTIAINLPNDERVQIEKGTRRLQLKNAMRAKYERILLPIADELIDAAQRPNLSFDAFFANVMFHEVAHGLGIKNTINGRGTVRDALREHASALEEAKADVLGLYMVTKLKERGELATTSLEDHYVTFLAGFLRSVRFGAASAHGVANTVEFNFLEREGAFSFDPASGRYRVDPERFGAAIERLAGVILKLQGDGDYDGVSRLYADQGVVHEELAHSLERLGAADIPVDVVFEQGLDVLGLAPTAK